MTRGLCKVLILICKLLTTVITVICIAFSAGGCGFQSGLGSSRAENKWTQIQIARKESSLSCKTLQDQLKTFDRSHLCHPLQCWISPSFSTSCWNPNPAEHDLVQPCPLFRWNTTCKTCGFGLGARSPRLNWHQRWPQRATFLRNRICSYGCKALSSCSKLL